MSFSGNSIKKLGKRLREERRLPDDIELLEAFRASFDLFLINISFRIDDLLRLKTIPSVLTGRSKRTKSIIRKLKRSRHEGMDLSRMDDIVGVRVIVEGSSEQDTVYDRIINEVNIKNVKDYRDCDNLYRAIHIIAVSNSRRLLEIQLRTLAQHLWAVESEFFGEQVKEGGGTPTQEEYLKTLSTVCLEIDENNEMGNLDFDGVLWQKRNPLSLYQDLKSFFDKIAYSFILQEYSGDSYIVVYDNQLKQLISSDHFPVNSRAEAIKAYQYRTRSFDDSQGRYEVLFLNSKSKDSLQVTHPTFI